MNSDRGLGRPSSPTCVAPRVRHRTPSSPSHYPAGRVARNERIETRASTRRQSPAHTRLVTAYPDDVLMFHVKHDAPSSPPARSRRFSTLSRTSRAADRREAEDVGMAYMYILECSDKSLYVGSTRDLERRFAQHNNGEGALYTQSRLPVRLLYFEQFDRVDDAYRREKQVQGWGRAKRLALARGELDRLPPLAKKDFAKRANVSRDTPSPDPGANCGGGSDQLARRHGAD